MQSPQLDGEDLHDILHCVVWALYHAGSFPPHASPAAVCGALVVLAEACAPECAATLAPVAANAIDEAFSASIPTKWVAWLSAGAVAGTLPFPVRSDLVLVRLPA